jgi:hypothetical protein
VALDRHDAHPRTRRVEQFLEHRRELRALGQLGDHHRGEAVAHDEVVHARQLGLTMVRSRWMVSNLTIQLYQAPSGRLAWQGVGNCTEHVESESAAPVPRRSVMPEVAAGGAEAHPVPESPSEPDAYAPADRPEIEPEPDATRA